MKIFIQCVLAMLFAPMAFAHDGNHHAGLVTNILHLFSQPDHLLAALSVITVSSLGYLLVQKLRAKRTSVARHK